MSTQKSASELVSPVGGFIAGGIAACGAVTVTNPIELVKTRMQLQGELSSKVAVYKNPVQAFGLIYRNEGIRGLQQGLVCGYYYQICLNGCRIGLFEPSRYYLTKWFSPSTFTTTGVIPQNLAINVGAGLSTGVAGAILANPLFLIKTRMQSYTKLSETSTKVVGEQTHYKNVFDGFRKIIKGEGLKGLYRGLDASILRTGTGSSVQLSSYNLAKNFLNTNKIIESNGLPLHLASASFSGLCVAIAMNPWDVVLTRVYNQKGNLYTGPIDCFVKTVKHEGLGAFYKGFLAQVLRVGPHTILTLIFMEHTMKAVYGVESALFD